MGTVKPKKNQLNALDLLVMQHDQVEELISQLEEDDLEVDKKRVLFRELADNVAAHATMEEQIFYPAIRAKQTEEILLESTEEHLAIRRVLADLLETDLDDPRFEARLSVLKEQIEHHAREEEEKELFPKLRRLMPAEELDALGSEMLALFERLMTQDPRLEVPKQTDKPARV
ncbi:MAG: hemerythrin domain-containing protein [Myxococcota bacterium]|nr:hemerythrin domain-containing protein [Myxococcota bacterium]